MTVQTLRESKPGYGCCGAWVAVVLMCCAFWWGVFFLGRWVWLSFLAPLIK